MRLYFNVPATAKFLFVLLVVSILFLWWAQNHVWLAFDEQSIIVDGRPLAEDYVPVKSLKGDLLLRNQDSQPEYLIDLEAGKIHLVGDYEFLDFNTLITWNYPPSKNDQRLQELINKNIVITNEYVEFSDIWERRWRVPITQ